MEAVLKKSKAVRGKMITRAAAGKPNQSFQVLSPNNVCQFVAEMNQQISAFDKSEAKAFLYEAGIITWDGELRNEYKTGIIKETGETTH